MENYSGSGFSGSGEDLELIETTTQTTVIENGDDAPTATYKYFPFVTATLPNREKRDHIPIIEN